MGCPKQLKEEDFKTRLVTEEAKLKSLLPPKETSADDVAPSNDATGEGERGGESEKESESPREEGEGERIREVAKQAAIVKYLKVSCNYVYVCTVHVCTHNIACRDVECACVCVCVCRMGWSLFSSSRLASLSARDCWGQRSTRTS